MSVEPGFLPEIGKLDKTQPHTVKDLENYVVDNIGAEVIERIQRNEAFHIVEGDGHARMIEFQRRGWKNLKIIQKKYGFHETLVLSRGEQQMNVILRVNGDDRIHHIQSLLRLAGIQADKMYTHRGRLDLRSIFLEAFKNQGHKPDLVVYGLTYNVVESLLGSKDQSSISIKDLMRNGSFDLSTPDISSRQMKVIQLKNGRVIWLMYPLYGDLTLDFFAALASFKVDNVLYLGTAGGISADMQVGEWVFPKLSGLKPVGIKMNSRNYQQVPTVNIQTVEWLAQITSAGVEVIEAELSYAQRVSNQNPQMNVQAGLVISEVLQGPNHNGFSEIRTGEIPGLKENIDQILKLNSHLGLGDRTAVRAYSIPFSSPAE